MKRPAQLDKSLSYYFGAGANQTIDAVRRPRDGDDEPDELSCFAAPFKLSSCAGSTEALQLLGAAGEGECAEKSPHGWSRNRSSHEMAISADGLLAERAPATHHGKKRAYVGAMGDTCFREGRHVFAVRVTEPVDDHYWVGVAYTDCDVNGRTKKNPRCIAWSGGTHGGADCASRPGTLVVSDCESLRTLTCSRPGARTEAREPAKVPARRCHW